MTHAKHAPAHAAAKGKDDAVEKSPASPPKFGEGSRVTRPYCESENIPAGVGTVSKCCPCDEGGPCEYEVRDEATGRTVRCKESDLTAA